MSNVLDKVIGWFDPLRGLRREHARNTLLAVRGYDGASAGRRLSGLIGNQSDADQSNVPHLMRLRQNLRELRRNNGWVAKGVQCFTDGIVGQGINGTTGFPEVDSEWHRWINSSDCDADGNLTFFGIQRIVVSALPEAGGAFVVPIYDQSEDGKTRLRLRVLEYDYLDVEKKAAGCSSGVQRDPSGTIVGYWLFDKHPGGASPGKPVSKLYEARNVAHVFEPLRPGQSVGVPAFFPIVLRVNDMGQAEDAELQRRMVAACFAAFVTSDGEMALGTGDKDGKTAKITPAMIQNLPPGTNVQFGTPPSVPDGASYWRTCLRGIAAGMRYVTFEELTGDYFESNFSASKMARQVTWRACEGMQRSVVIPKLCDPVWRWKLEEMAMNGLVSPAELAAIRMTWTPPGMPSLDPASDTAAEKESLRSGLTTFSDVLRKKGTDPRSHFQELSNDWAMIDELGLKLDVDSRSVKANNEGK